MKELLAAITFFTRLPLWRVCHIPTDAFKNVVPFWSLTGWLTGGIMAATYMIAEMILPMSVALVLALLSRILLTGALHEDGLADFCDGFGGGRNDRSRIMAIMKDSHIGTYGVIGLIIYYMMCYMCLLEMPSWLIPAMLICGDTWSKFCASQIVNFLPYARKESEAKNRTVYERMTPGLFCASLAGGALPLLLLPAELLPAIIFPAITSAFMIRFMKRRIEGYTGDCCGATFLICELSFYVGGLIIRQFCSVI